jgi:hypothetical protein
VAPLRAGNLTIVLKVLGFCVADSALSIVNEGIVAACSIKVSWQII